MPQTSNERRCSAMMCSNQGKLLCTGCKGAEPPTTYCGERCQKQDWIFHKKYCGKDAYTFDLTLLDTSDPVIKRTFDVPSWFTFRQLHYTLQYAMGPWQCTHLHEFSFGRPVFSSRGRETNRVEVLRIGTEELYDLEDLPVAGEALQEVDDKLLLKDVFDPSGKLYELVAPEGEVYPLTYVYDFGDWWELELIFKEKKLAREDRPLFSSAQGRGPVEDCGSTTGWNNVKAAFRKPASQRNQNEHQLVGWAQDTSGLGEEFDPFKEPDVIQMNYEGRWENHLEHFKEMSGESDDFDSDDDGVD